MNRVKAIHGEASHPFLHGESAQIRAFHYPWWSYFVDSFKQVVTSCWQLTAEMFVRDGILHRF